MIESWVCLGRFRVSCSRKPSSATMSCSLCMNSILQLLSQVSFTIYSKVALSPMMCLRHSEFQWFCFSLGAFGQTAAQEYGPLCRVVAHVSDVHTYVHTYIYMHAHVRPYIHTYILSYLLACHVNTHTHICIYIYSIYLYLGVYKYICICT